MNHPILNRLVWPLAALLLALWGLLTGAGVHAQTPETRLTVRSGLYHAADQAFPASGPEVSGWAATLTATPRVRFTGDESWLVMELTNRSANADWVFSPHGSLIERVDARLYREGQPPQTFQTGYQAEHAYMLHYGVDITVPPGERAWLVARLSSPFYASQPEFSVPSRADYRRTVSFENFLILMALGALVTLSFYNLFIYAGTHNRSFLFYAAYMLTYCAGWAFTFHLPADVFGLRNLRLHYLWFFLLPVLNTLFYLHFLQLESRVPLLARLSRWVVWLALALLPTSFFLLAYAHVLATAVISLWLVLALVSGVVSWRQGFAPARFFVLGLLALLIPAAVILPGNVGLSPDVPFNSELFTLLGGTLDGLLLAFALADMIRLLSRQNQASIVQLQRALHLARTDNLTGLHNRYAFEQVFNAEDSARLLIVMDLDGLKGVNDQQGHTSGDELLRTFSQHLRDLEREGVTAYRLGGDEFALLAPLEAEAELTGRLQDIERAMQTNHPSSGVSFGVAHTSAAPKVSTFDEADQRMYHHKQAKKRNVRASLLT
ncbi:sensor domain-containing diguanylate cyclase [Deinococcus sp. HMF7604]|uniref:GGDEF domain-containing protein n=1 Tax=Deinococcus betulae TaxID=2873312 RepID=UPI001CCCB718|nr:GGDEF domain-containing protein [Deinococcus betulae]MBZ9752348.1 sensor domain-containing diguanylate cyclase [Deinococcus betulae]